MQLIKYDKKYQKIIPKLFVNTIHKTCNKDYTKEQLNAWANPNIDYKSWEERLNKTKPYLAILDKKLVGFAEFYEDYIDCFYVHYKYQGCGVGKMLLNHIFKVAEEKKQTLLKVDASITAKPFFEKFGFIEVKKNKVKRNNIELINFSMQKIENEK
ncbi:GNAT family N-acetyltransferase [Arcobacter sp. F2176]|uniref:GNAT family N-acetyltransferase n=1 Tax=Arcobacter sp. F2176 TaxID=2044511 RepID=UPI00100B26E1|nr:GNAT family N-acetyltransferase [Arcobacter sp. F2176]RXJ82518.1 hypothetical protein CRU95_00185 [Arcobacter sp. F2176]